MSNFEKFSNPKPKGAKKKELIRQDKRQEKAERKEYYEQKKKNAAAASGPVRDGAKPKKAAVRKNEAAAAKAVSPAGAKKTAHPKAKQEEAPSSSMPLNKFIAHSGICSRRDAAALVKDGKVKVNGQVKTEPGYKIQADDKITVDGKPTVRREQLVYILMNKPKDYLTTAEDDKGRKTVLDLIKNHVPQRVYPVGRLDRNTTGVLLLTNDGDLAQQLSHPKFEIRKVYEAKLDKPITKADLDKLVEGFELEDGHIAADAAAFADMKDRSVVGIELHSGRNRIVRRMFEHLGYDVKNLDRVVFANLTKKTVERGKWRFLNDREVRLLKYFQKSKRNK